MSLVDSTDGAATVDGADPTYVVDTADGTYTVDGTDKPNETNIANTANEPARLIEPPQPIETVVVVFMDEESARVFIEDRRLVLVVDKDIVILV